jgi:hypothetical protein
MYLPIPKISLKKIQNIANVSADTISHALTALASSRNVSVNVSVGSPAQTNTMAEDPPMITARMNRFLLALYFMV